MASYPYWLPFARANRMFERPCRSLTLAVGALTAMLLPVGASAADVYSWSPNVAAAQPPEDHQQGETALATDAKGRIWLAFIDAQYHRVATGNWIDWPRAVRLFVSSDGGRTFDAQPDLGEPAGDQALAADRKGRVFASYVQYSDSSAGRLQQQIVVRRLDEEQPANTSCLPWDDKTRHDQSSIHIGAGGDLYVIGADIGGPDARGLLFARSLDDGRTCLQAQRLAGLAELPQVVEAAQATLIVGPGGYYTSKDHGVTFSVRRTRRFGQKLVRVDVSPDRKRVYVVGDSVSGGLVLSISEDGGNTWSVTHIGAADQVRAWRYPAVHVNEDGRVHIVWIDDRGGSAALYHVYSDDGGARFSTATKISDAPFIFPADAPPPPPATQDGTWIGDYLSLTTFGKTVVVAWSDQRAGTPKSVVRTSVGTPR
ncbi:MAG: exo-alpha-sialidase [Methylobacteriaceae bacterium]|nr:exo-alpha-sialidase [Methylobacteriaceae bacterium]MBV9705362.1 exo-alpha-sialidase [Methylobacteriaceae bacterium]